MQRGSDAATVAARWRADRAAYPARAWLREPSLYALAWLRAGQWIATRGPFVRRLGSPVYWLVFRLLEVQLGVSITRDTEVGGGLRVHHFGGIFVNERTVIGSRCALRQGVTLGSRRDDGPAPVLGDGVDVGAYAQILGGVRIGDGARIGAMAVVLRDVPAGAAVAGNPAREVGAGAADGASVGR